nr:tannase/feruloyl esterase family alpha/beta hydrolase [uncultured Tolumonas sp.]
MKNTYSRISKTMIVGLSLFLAFSVFAETKNSQSAINSDQLAITPLIACSELNKVDLEAIGGKGSKVTAATEIQASGKNVCTVEGVLAPSIGFKVKLPMNNWHSRYLQIGCGGLCGSISEQVGAASGCAPVTNGEFVVSATDMGHQGMGGEFGRDPQKRADFAFRSLHLTSLVSKILIKNYYGKEASYSYFSGCSDGGREALIEAQRYPNDFNGIIAGAPAMNFETQNGIYHAWLAQSNTGKDGKPIVLAARLPLIHQAVLAQCDALDGQIDGLISDPLACHFDPKTLQCKNKNDTQSTGCLSAAEAEAVKRFYTGPVDPKTGKKLIAGGPLAGSELAWAGVFIPHSEKEPIFSQIIASGALSVLFEGQPRLTNFSFSKMKFDSALFNKLRKMHPFYDATNPDLSKFYARGGKLILWHGLADPHISPLNTIAYHEAVHKFMGEYQANTFERLYLLPGMYHCEGGEGPNKIDLLTPMMDWVEHNKAPEAIVTKKPKADEITDFGAPVREKGKDKMEKEAKADTAIVIEATRPVYPYPYIAVYNNQGDIKASESYTSRQMKTIHNTPDWEGNDFFKPYRMIN